jgi:hypothetical protein
LRFYALARPVLQILLFFGVKFGVKNCRNCFRLRENV